MREEGLLRDLAEKKKAGKITSEEAVRELHKRGLQHGKYSNPWITIIPMIGGGMLCFISGLAKATGMPMLEPLTKLPAFVFPPVLIGLAVIFGILAMGLILYSACSRVMNGGTTPRYASETTVLTRNGLYGVMRHPENIGFFMFFVSLTVFSSNHVPFNVLSVIGTILLTIGCYFACVEGEKLNVLKWGDEYKQYMEEVPRFNFVLGIWRRLKKK